MRVLFARAAATGIAVIAVSTACSPPGPDPVALPASTTAASTTKAAPDLAEKGDCVRDNGKDYTEVPCSSPEATHVVLQRLSGRNADCRKVPGVDYTYQDVTGADAKICLGNKGLDPANGLNVVEVGDCILSGEGLEGQRIPCDAPGSVFRVLSRLENSPLTPQTCNAVPGTVRTHGWRLEQMGTLSFDPPGPKIFDLVFCLGPAR